MHLGKPLTQESSWSQLLDTKSKLPSLSKDTKSMRIDSAIDSLHAAELGITAHVLGTICQLCVNARVFGATVDANIKNLAIDLDGRSAGRRRIVSTTNSRKTAFAPGPTGHNCTPKMLFGDAWSRTLWDWRGNILDPEKNWFAKCWCLCWLLKDNSSRPRPELRWRRWVFASANRTQSSRRQQRRRDKALEIVAQTASVLHFCEWQFVSLGNQRFLCVAQTKTWSANWCKRQNRLTRAPEDLEDRRTDSAKKKYTHIMIDTQTSKTHITTDPQTTRNMRIQFTDNPCKEIVLANMVLMCRCSS